MPSFLHYYIKTKFHFVYRAFIARTFKIKSKPAPLVITHSGSRVPKINCKPVQRPNSTYVLRKADCNCFVFYSLVITMLHSLQAQIIWKVSVIVFNHNRFNSQSSYSFTCKLPYEENSLFFCKAWHMSKVWGEGCVLVC